MLCYVNLTSPLCTGTYLCGYVSTLPDGIALLIGNDLCYNQSVAGVTVVTRSMTATENAKTDQQVTQNSSESITDEKMSTDIAENNFPSAEILADVGHLFDENQATLENLSRETLIELQQRDQSLRSLFTLCNVCLGILPTSVIT